MPILSRFTPCGFLTLSSDPSHGEQIYDAMIRSQGGAYTGETAGRQEAKIYAQAMGIAEGLYALEHAGLQQFARTADELFAVLEEEHGLTPNARDTEAERMGALAARMKLPSGASQTNISNALKDLLGSDFVSYRPTPISEMIAYPTSINDQPMNLQLPTVVRKRLKLLTAITIGLGAPQQVQYTETLKNGTDTSLLAAVGDVIVVEAAGATEERVTVSAISTVLGNHYLTATFNQPHAANAIAVTQPYPMWSSTKRYSLVVLTAAAAADAEKREKVHDLMGRIARGVSTWAIAGASSSTTTGPFTVGGGMLGITTIGTVTL